MAETTVFKLRASVYHPSTAGNLWCVSHGDELEDRRSRWVATWSEAMAIATGAAPWEGTPLVITEFEPTLATERRRRRGQAQKVRQVAPPKKRQWVRITLEKAAWIATARAQGISVKQIALELGVSAQSVRNHLPSRNPSGSES